MHSYFKSTVVLLQILFALLLAGCFGPSYQERIESVLAQQRSGQISQQSAAAAINAIRAEQETDRAYYLKQAEEARERQAKLELEKEQARLYGETHYGSQHHYGEHNKFFPPHSPYSTILVKVYGGKIAFYGERRGYQVAQFFIRDGESKMVRFNKESNGYEHSDIWVSYTGGVFRFDLDARQPYEVFYADTWRRGMRYAGFTQLEGKNSKSEAQGITIEINAAGDGR